MYYGDYYRGDYYRGDPGIFGFLGKAATGLVKTGLGIAGTVMPGPFGGVARTARAALFPSAAKRATTRTVAPPPPTIVPPAMDAPAGITYKMGPVLPGTGYVMAGKKRRRMNYGNTKALRRADRRIDGFVKVARSALKHTNYKVVSKSAGSRRGGSPGVITRAEARRALRG